MNHNHVPADPLVAPPQNPLEQVQPVTGAELVAHLETRIPVGQRERLYAVGAKFDEVMLSLGQLPPAEVLSATGAMYLKERTKAFDGLAGNRFNNPLSPNQHLENLDLESPTRRDALFPVADHKSISAGILEHLEVKPRTFVLGGVKLDAPGPRVEYAVEEAGRAISAGARDSAVKATKAKTDRLIDVNKDRQVDTDARVEDAFTVGAEQEATYLTDTFSRVLGDLERAFPAKVKEVKLARFLTRQSGHESVHGENAGLYLGRLEQAMQGALTRRDFAATAYLRKHALGEAGQVSQQAMALINRESAKYIANLVGLPHQPEVLRFATDFLRSKNLEVASKTDPKPESNVHEEQARLTPAQKIEARAIEEVDRMRQKGWTDKNIKAAFAQRAANGHVGAQDQLPYVTAFLKPVSADFRENGTTTK